MNKLFFIILIVIAPLISFGQSKYNLGFEDGAKKWIVQLNGYESSIDTIFKYEGDKSLKITAVNNITAVIGIFADLLGKEGDLKISYTLKKTSTDSIDPKIFLQISDNDIIYGDIKKEKYENGWEKHTTAIEVQKLNSVAIGITYNGAENIWIDDFDIKVNGINLDNLKDLIYIKIKNDNEFDHASKINKIKISKKNTNKLYKLCKIWGLLKYYHPNIGEANFNWDYELFRIIPSILNDNMDFNSTISEWIDKVDSINKSYKSKQDRLILDNDIFNWVTEKEFGVELYKKLIGIISTTDRITNYYVSFHGITYPLFGNENAYKNIKSNDLGYHILGLFRAWNIIEYFFPYKYITDNNWDDVLKEYIPIFANSDNTLEYEKAIFQFSAEICDSHVRVNGATKIYSNLGINFKKGLPIKAHNIENKCIVVELNKNKLTPFKIGDIITHIDGKKIDKVVKDNSKYFATSIKNVLYNQLYNYILSYNAKDSVEIKGIRDGVKIEFYARTYKKKYKAPKKLNGCNVLEGNIGYINAGYLDSDIDSVMTSFMDKKAIILDLRIYPKSFMIYSIGKHLMPKKVDFVKFKQTSLNTPGIYNIEDNGEIGMNNTNYYKGDVIIIVNEGTISRGEFTTMGWSLAPKATVIGSQTVGADGNVTSFTLPGNYSMTYTGLGIYYPNGEETQRIGVRIDEIIKPSIKGIKEGRDELLERAIEIINEK